MTDHERLLKELIVNFYVDFVDILVPQVSIFLDKQSVHLRTDSGRTIAGRCPGGTDILATAKVHGQDSVVLVHIAPATRPDHEVGQDMFRRFSWLYEEFGLPVCPVVVLANDAPSLADSSRFRVSLPHKIILDFSYLAVPLHRLNWRDYVRKPNPIACALMSRMRVSPDERFRVKSESLRLLSTLELEPSRRRMIAKYINAYLPLTADEEKKIRWKVDLSDLESVDVATAEDSDNRNRMGKVDIILRQLSCRTGILPGRIAGQIENLTSNELDDLGEALLSFSHPAEIEGWLRYRVEHHQYA